MIYDVHDLQNMSNDPNAHYVLAKDIDASETREWNWNETEGSYRGFMPVGSGHNPFKGTLDGQGYDVADLYINLPYSCGLFGSVDSGLIRNIGLVDINVSGVDRVGGLVGINDEGTVNNSYATGNVSGDDYVGGLVGENYWGGTVENSYATGTVIGSYNVGGLTGVNYAKLSNCYSTVDVSGEENVGGLVGENYGTICNSYATGNVSGNNSVGGFVGYNSGTVSNSFSNGNTRGDESVGGLVGYNRAMSTVTNSYTIGNVTRKTNSTETDIGGFVGLNDQGIITNCYSIGRVTYENETDPTDKGFSGKVTTGGSYEMTGNFWDVETSGQTSTSGNATGKSTEEMKTQSTFTDASWDFKYSWFMEEGVTYPLHLWQRGNGTADNPFLIYDVWDLQDMNLNTYAHYALANDIDASETEGWNDGAGFISIGRDRDNCFTGTFDGRNFTINGIYIDRSSMDYIGLFGVVDRNGGVHNIGVVELDIIGNRYVGGLVGYNLGTVSNSYAMGNITGDNSVGGLIGYNIYGNVSYSHADVAIRGDHSVGGLVGLNSYDGTVSNSYTSGIVSGNRRIGGLVGHNSIYAKVYNSYAQGNVTGEKGVGGLIGYSIGAVFNSHYNIDDVLINGENHVTIGGIFDAQYQDWFLNDLYLNISDYSSTLIPSEDHYEINNVQGLRDLLGFADRIGYRFRLTEDIDLSSMPGLYVPYFMAEFDGNNHTISGLIINRTFSDNIGMFGYTGMGAMVKNVRLINNDINANDYVGGLVGYNIGTVYNSYADGTITGSYTVGGLTGLNWGTIERSYVSGTVFGSHNVGGLVGVNGQFEFIFSKSIVSNSSSAADLVGNNFIGGLVGINHDTIFNSYATGVITGDEYVGGFVGYNNAHRAVGIIFNSYATGVITGDEFVGGFVGFNYYGTIENSYSRGAVIGVTGVGDFIGYNRFGMITSPYATGETTGDEYVGGFVGFNLGVVENSFWDINTTGMNTSVGGEGKTTAEMMDITTFSNAGWDIGVVDSTDARDTDSIWNIVETETYPFLSWQEVVIHPEFTLEILTEGNGTTDPAIGNHTYNYGQEVVVEAIPDEGWYFSHWTGDVPNGQETNENITIVMDGDKAITAHFEQIYHNFTISVEGEGSTSPNEGDHTYAYGTEVNLTATPETGWRFSHWGGDVPEGEEENANITVVMDSDKTVTAHFEQIYHNLTISVEGEGTTDPSAGNNSYAYGTQVNLTATPDEGWYFSHWSGNVTAGNETNANITIVMDGDKNITAHFYEIVPPSVEITSPYDGEEFDTDTVTVEWRSEEGTYPVSHYEIRLNDGEWMNVGDRTHHTFDGLNDGTYDITVRAVDIMGNEATDTSSITVDTGVDMFIGLLILALLIVLALVLFMMWKKERGTGIEDEDELEDEIALDEDEGEEDLELNPEDVGHS